MHPRQSLQLFGRAQRPLHHHQRVQQPALLVQIQGVLAGELLVLLHIALHALQEHLGDLLLVGVFLEDEAHIVG